MIRPFWTKPFSLVFGLLLCMQAAAQRPAYEVVDLGTLGGDQSLGLSINDYSEVSGGSRLADDSWRAFIYVDGLMTNLGLLESEPADGVFETHGNAINNNGVVVGQASSSAPFYPGQRAFIGTEDGLSEIIIPDSDSSAALDVNDSGGVVGRYRHRYAGRTLAFYYGTDGFEDIETWGDNSVASVINDAGLIAGVAYRTLGGEREAHAFFKNLSTGELYDAGKLGPNSVEVNDINNLGQITGQANIRGASPRHAYIGTTSGIRDLGTLGDTSVGYGINDSSQVVGWSVISGVGSRAFLWDELNGMMSLSDLVVNLEDAGFSYIYMARDINNFGYITGAAVLPNGDYHAVLLVPAGYLNTAPVANAGEDQAVFVNDVVPLNGSFSYDDDGDALTYSWSISAKPEGSSALLDDNNIVSPSFEVDVAGTYVVSLVVDDGQESSVADSVFISTINRAPVADAGEDQNVGLNVEVMLNGSASFDADGDILTFHWIFTSKPDGSAAQLNDEKLLAPSFTADAAGNYALELVVNDGMDSSPADSVTITVSNTLPVANAGDDQEVHVNDLVTLDGSASFDADGDALTYHWVFTSKPDGSAAQLNDGSLLAPSFTADLAGSYILELVVSDGTGGSEADSVTMTTLNRVPVADAGPDQRGFIRRIIVLDGSGSFDPDGDALTYRWVITQRPRGSRVSLNNSDTVSPSFRIDRPGRYTLSLIVNDGSVDSEVDTVTVSTRRIQLEIGELIDEILATVNGNQARPFRRFFQRRVLTVQANTVVQRISRGRFSQEQAVTQLERSLLTGLPQCRQTAFFFRNNRFVECTVDRELLRVQLNELIEFLVSIR